MIVSNDGGLICGRGAWFRAQRVVDAHGKTRFGKVIQLPEEQVKEGPVVRLSNKPGR
jgi:hypothetical protein